MTARFTRPPTPPGFDPSRAAERAADPSRWRYDDARLQAVYDVIAERRDVRRFRPDEVDDDVLQRVLTAAHQAPSVGLMQPWRLIVLRDERTRSEIRALAQRERLRQADQFDERTRHFLDQKIEGVVEAPVGVCVCCDRPSVVVPDWSHSRPGDTVEQVGRCAASGLSARPGVLLRFITLSCNTPGPPIPSRAPSTPQAKSGQVGERTRRPMFWPSLIIRWS